MTALILAPVVAQNRRDPRLLVFFGVFWMGCIELWRTIANTDVAFWDIAILLAVLGIGLPFFFIPTTAIVLGSVEESEMDSAAGLMNFLRTLAGPAATSIVTTVWSNGTTHNHAELVESLDRDGSARTVMEHGGMTPGAVNGTLDYVLTIQSGMLATNQVMMAVAVMFIVSSAFIWLAPKPTRTIEPGAGGY